MIEDLYWQRYQELIYFDKKKDQYYYDEKLPERARKSFENYMGIKDEPKPTPHKVDLEEAIELARSRRPEIDRCAEYKNAFIFWCTEDEGKDGPQPVVVKRRTGRVQLMPEYVLSHGKEGKFIKEFAV